MSNPRAKGRPKGKYKCPGCGVTKDKHDYRSTMESLNRGPTRAVPRGALCDRCFPLPAEKRIKQAENQPIGKLEFIPVGESETRHSSLVLAKQALNHSRDGRQNEALVCSLLSIAEALVYQGDISMHVRKLGKET